MPSKTHLFAVTHWLLRAATVLSFAIGIVLAVAISTLIVVALIPGHFGIPAEIGHDISQDIPQGISRDVILDLILKIGFFLASGLLVCTVIIAFALRLTTRIVETAMRGDPFVTENAHRLMLIGWLLLAVQAAGLISGMLAQMIVDGLPAAFRHKIQLDGFGLDPSLIGLLAVLLIFVLAQVFRRGSEMRDELEATV